MNPQVMDATLGMLDPEEIPGVVRALAIFEKLDRISPEKVADWRRAILDRWGLRTPEGSAWGFTAPLGIGTRLGVHSPQQYPRRVRSCEDSASY
jgi:hypothetical protein